MTIIMTLVGIVVFIISLFTAGFKSAAIRLLVMSGIGLAIDLSLAMFGLFVLHATF